jgi:hypothetical protein
MQPLGMQSRIVRGLIQPLGGLTALATFVAVYESLREVSFVSRCTSAQDFFIPDSGCCSTHLKPLPD